WGNPPRRMLIDGGVKKNVVFQALSDRMKQVPAAESHFEVFVVTHVDDDHIGGAINVMKNLKELGCTFGDVWFNGYVHLVSPDELGAAQGEEFSKLLVDTHQLWNRAFGGKAVVARPN